MKELYNRVKSKVLREIANRHRSGAQYQKQMTFVEKDSHWYEPVMASPSTFINDCTNSVTVAGVIDIIQKLEPDKFTKFNLEYYRTGVERFGSKWRYADINTVLYGICNHINVERYMEIGVRRGRSMSIVAALHPDAQITGFDMWIKNYVGIENPGPEFVREELEKVGYKQRAEFISGNSRVTVPKYFKDNPDVFFDIITVDGDHTAKGARIDLKNVIPRLKVGGFLVFDDICNSYHTQLKRIWERTVAKSRRFMAYSFEELGYGVAFGIKKY